MPQDHEIRRRVILAHPTVILAERDIQFPGTAVFNAPVPRVMYRKSATEVFKLEMY